MVSASERRRFGFKEVLGQAEIEVLAPSSSWRGVGANNNSIIPRRVRPRVVPHDGRRGEGRTGESRAAEKRYFEARAPRVENGTDAAHLAAIAPKLAVVTFGRGNRYQHPHKEVFGRAAGVWRRPVRYGVGGRRDRYERRELRRKAMRAVSNRGIRRFRMTETLRGNPSGCPVFFCLKI